MAAPPSPPTKALSSSQKEEDFCIPENKDWQHSRCQKIVAETLEGYQPVRILLNALAKSGCPVDETFIHCKPCNKKVLGHFSPKHGIVLCQNFEVPKIYVQETITHELIHAYDLCRANLDLNNCIHQACTEIRAAQLSGDCKFVRELQRGKPHLINHLQDCVFRRAELSLLLNEKCKNNATQYVRKAWDVCIKDYEPWNKIPY